MEDAVELCVNETLNAYRNRDSNAGVDVSMNAAPRKWIAISNSLAFMIFKTLTAGNLLGALIIEERRNRMKDRIMLSGVKKSSYLLGMALVYLVFMMIRSKLMKKQRVVLAAALLRNRPILILDEPTSGLDGRHMRIIAEYLRRAAERGTCILVITHDREFINIAADEVLEIG